jgi:hypothetical protein
VFVITLKNAKNRSSAPLAHYFHPPAEQSCLLR